MNRPRREREAPEIVSACRRLMVALARRAGDGELEALEGLAALQAILAVQLQAAVTGYREGPAQASWTTIGSILGMTRQSAHERFKMSETLFDAVPDPATRRWLVKWRDVTLSLTAEEYDALKCAAMDDSQEAMRLAESYRTRDNRNEEADD